MADPIDEFIKRALEREMAPATAGGSSATKPKRDLEAYSETELRYLYRADALTEEQWKAELVARGETPASAQQKIAGQLTTGVSTAAATRGQLTASEQAKVDAYKASAPTATQRLDARVAKGDYGQQGPTPSGAPLEDITGGATGSGASGGAGPAGRTVDQVRGTQYLSDAERSWYLQQTGGATAPAGGGTSTARATTSSGGSTAAPRATSSGGSAAAPAASGGGGVATPGKLTQGSINLAELTDLGASFSGALASLRYPDGSMDVYVRQPDGSYDYRRTEAAPPAPPPRKVSPSEQAATSWVNTQQILKGGPKIGEQSTIDRFEAITDPATGQSWVEDKQTGQRLPMGSFEEAGAYAAARRGQQTGAPQADPQTLRNYADPASIMGGGSPYRGEARDLYAPTSALGQPGQLAGVERPYMGGSSTYLPGHAAQDIAAAGMIPTGDPQKDLVTGAAVNAKRANWLAEYGDPLKVQSMFDSMNLGTDVYGRAKAVAATESAADRAISGERMPSPGTDMLTASQLSNYVTPRAETPGVSYKLDPETGQYVQGFAEGGQVVAGDYQPEEPPRPIFNPDAQLDPSQVQMRGETFMPPPWQDVMANYNYYRNFNDTNPLVGGNGGVRNPAFQGFAGGGSVSVEDDPFKTLNAPGTVTPEQPVPTMPGMDSVEGDPARKQALDAMGARQQNQRGPFYASDGSISREIDGQMMNMPATGGRYQPMNMVLQPSIEDFNDQLWGGAPPAASSANSPLYRKLFGEYVAAALARWGLNAGGVDFDGSNNPRPLLLSNGRSWTFGGSRGPRSIGMGSFAGGGQISVGDPMQMMNQQNQMVTDEPMVGIGMESLQPRFTVGEPNMLTGGAPTREILSGGNGTMNVTPLEQSIPMPTFPSPMQMQAPYKTKRPVPLIDPMQALRAMKV